MLTISTLSNEIRFQPHRAERPVRSAGERRHRGTFRLLASVCLLAAGGSLVSATAAAASETAPPPPPAANKAPAATKYTCPMHPEVVADQPGRCPKCGMKLVPKDPAAPGTKK